MVSRNIQRTLAIQISFVSYELSCGITSVVRASSHIPKSSNEFDGQRNIMLHAMFLLPLHNSTA